MIPSTPKRMTGIKRENVYSIEEELNKIDNESKKNNSAETKKTLDLKLKQVKYFFAKLETKYEDKEFEDNEKFSKEDLIFKYRREKAKEIINKIENENEQLSCIENSLKFDNTNKTCIYKLLNYYYKNEDKQKFEDALNNYKYCITQKFYISEKGKEIYVDINKLYKINLPIDELEELPNSKKNEYGSIRDLRNSVVEFFTNYYYISKYVQKFKKIVGRDNLEKFLTFKYAKSSKNSFLLNYENDEKLDLLPTNKQMKKKQKEKKGEKDEEEEEEEEEEDSEEDKEEENKCDTEKNKEEKKVNMNKEIEGDKTKKEGKLSKNIEENIEKEENTKDKKAEINKKDEEGKNDRDKLLKSIEYYLSKYLYYQDFNLFQMNQPIDYHHNLTLYYNYIIWSLYQIM